MLRSNRNRRTLVTLSHSGKLVFSHLLIAIAIFLVVSACGAQTEGNRASDDLIATSVAATVSARSQETPETDNVSLEVPPETQEETDDVSLEVQTETQEETDEAIGTPDPQAYANAEELDNVKAFWNLLDPSCISRSIEDVIAHRAWRSADLPEKILIYYDEMTYEENWEPDSRYNSCDGPWQYRSFRKGDEFMGLIVLGSLPSTLIAQLPDTGLETADSLILMAVGNPIEGMLNRGRVLLEKGNYKEAQTFAERVLNDRTSVGIGTEDVYVQEAIALLEETSKMMSTLDVTQEWFEDAVETDVFGERRFEELERMRLLGLVKEYESYGTIPIIDSYLPIGEWVEISNNGSTAVVEFVGKAVTDMTNRIAPRVEVQEFDYVIQVTLSRNSDGIWDINYPDSVNLLSHATSLYPKPEATILAEPFIDIGEGEKVREDIALVLENIETFRMTYDDTRKDGSLCILHKDLAFSLIGHQLIHKFNCQSEESGPSPNFERVQVGNRRCFTSPTTGGEWTCLDLDEEDRNTSQESTLMSYTWEWFSLLDPIRFAEDFVKYDDNGGFPEFEILNYQYQEGSLGGYDCHLLTIEYSNVFGIGKKTMCYDRATYYPLLIVSMDEIRTASGEGVILEGETRYFDFNEPIEISLPVE